MSEPPEQMPVEPLERTTLMAALQTREEYLSGILGSLECLVTIDDGWRLTYANAAALRLARMSADDLLGRDLHEYAVREFQGFDAAPLERAMGEKVVAVFEAVIPALAVVMDCTAYPLADGGLAIYARDVTRRQREKAARRASEEHYRNLVESVNSAIVRWTPDGTLTFFNEYAEQLFGWSSGEVLGRHVNVLLPEPTVEGEDLSRLVEDIVAHHEHYTTNVNQNVRRDGSRLWMAWTNRAVLDEDGAVTEILGVGNDITELVRTQEALGESEARFRSLADHSPFLIYVHDADGRLMFVNRTYREFFGVDEEVVAGTGWKPLVHPDDAERYTAEFTAATRERRPFACEARWRNAAGEWRWIDSRALPRYSASGEFLGMVGSAPDVTERKRAEDRVLASRDRLDLALSVGGIATWDLEVPTGTTIWNREHYLMLGYEPGGVEPSYESFRARVHPDDVDAVDAAFRDSLERRTDYVAEFRVLRPDGDVRFITAVGHLELDAEGAPQRQYGVMLDITERVRVELELRRADAERAAEQERIRLARDLHDSVTQSLFAASLKAEALTLAGDRSPAAAAALEEVRRLNRGALAQMRSLLLELRGDPVAQVPLQQLLRHLVEAAESRAGVNAGLSLDEGLALTPEVHEAVYRIAQEAMNNVVRHAGARNASIEVRGEDGRVRLVVRDDGRGFDPASVGRAHFGLASMSERAEETGGELRVVSGAGEGTVLTAVWPAA